MAVKIEVRDLKVWFPVRTSFLQNLYSKERQYVHAVDGISFEIEEGEFFCLVGESGCGKTTTAGAIARLIEPTSGEIRYSGIDLWSLGKRELLPYRRKLQIIFQDPYGSLNPRINVFDAIAEPLIVHNLIKNSSKQKDMKDMIVQVLEKVELMPAEDFLDKYPHELSGGQRQRVSLASSLALGPDFIIADEPVSMLDASVRAGILQLMLQLKEEEGLTYLLITHDLSLAWLVSDRIAVMYAGKIVELGSSNEIILNPQHPYTKALISVIPIPDPRAKHEKIILKKEPPDLVNIPSGCRFWPRCSEAVDICRKEAPALVTLNKAHYVTCHLLGGGLQDEKGKEAMMQQL